MDLKSVTWPVVRFLLKMPWKDGNAARPIPTLFFREEFGKNLVSQKWDVFTKTISLIVGSRNNCEGNKNVVAKLPALCRNVRASVQNRTNWIGPPPWSTPLLDFWPLFWGQVPPTPKRLPNSPFLHGTSLLPLTQAEKSKQRSHDIFTIVPCPQMLVLPVILDWNLPLLQYDKGPHRIFLSS